MASSSQKKANRKYAEKCTNKTVRFTANENKKLQKIEEYITKTNQSFSGLVKQLLIEHIDNEIKSNSAANPSNVDRINSLSFECFPFFDISSEEEESIDFLYENFNPKVIDRFFTEKLHEIDERVHDSGGDYFGCNNFPIKSWIEDEIMDMVKDGIFKDMTQDEIIEKLNESFCEYGLDDVPYQSNT